MMSATPPQPGPPPVPAVPYGWEVTWSSQYNQWFYTNQATGAPQWEHPDPAYAPPQRAFPQQYSQSQYAQTAFAGSPTTIQPAMSAAPAQSGIIGMLSNLDPKAQAALAVGGGLAAGALLEHEISGSTGPRQHWGHQGGEHHLLGSVAGLLGAAGAGALGAKLLGGKGQAAQNASLSQLPQSHPTMQQPTPLQGYPGPQPAAPNYSTPPPSYGPVPPAPPGGPPNSSLGGLGKFAAGGAAGVVGALALDEASHVFHQGGKDEAPPPPGGPPDSGIGSLFGRPTPSCPRLHIYGATISDKDVTDACRTKIDPDQSLKIGDMVKEFGDPWPENNVKQFTCLYQYGDRPLEIWASTNHDGAVDIRHEPLANARMAYINKEPGRIICLIWGVNNVSSTERLQKLETDGELDCKDLGGGSLKWDRPPTLVCYYKTANGRVAVATARQWGTLRLPWNPLAKWS